MTEKDIQIDELTEKLHQAEVTIMAIETTLNIHCGAGSSFLDLVESVWGHVNRYKTRMDQVGDE